MAAGVLGISLANAKNSQKGQTEALYEKENRALGQANSRLENEVLRLQTKVDALTQANIVLQETVSGAEAVKALRIDMVREEQSRRDEHGAMMMLMKDLIAQLRGRRGEIQ